jgi:hypothetical protein
MAETKLSFELIQKIGDITDVYKNGWSKSIIKCKWGDNNPTVDIRKINSSQNKFGSGISLTNEEADIVVDLLLNAGYGSIDVIKNCLKDRSSYIVSNENIEDMINNTIFNDDRMVINIGD